MNSSQITRRSHHGLYIAQMPKSSDLTTMATQSHELSRGLTGKTIHIVGPRRLQNELLVNFIRNETDANCVLTDFDLIEDHLFDTIEKPTCLFLIDYREPHLQERLKQASLIGDGSSLTHRLISLFNGGRENGSEAKRLSKSTCGVLFNCDSVTVLLDWLHRVFNGINNQIAYEADPKGMDGETATACPLTWRELQLLMLMTEGLRNKEIAGRIGISNHTVRTHLYNSFGKIGARNRLEASAWIDANVSFVFLLI